MAKKASKEELEQQLKKQIEEAENLPDKPIEEDEEETPSAPAPSTPAPSEPVPSQEPGTEQPALTDIKDDEVEEAPPEEEDENKKKLLASQQEGIVLHSKIKAVSKAVKDAVNSPEPTEDELKAKYPDWDMMTATEQILAKDNMKNSRVIANLISVTKESEDVEAWNAKVNTFIENPETLANIPDLDGKQDEFKLFASKTTRRNIPFEDLVAAFLYDQSKRAKPKSKGKMFETPTAGPSSQPKPKSDKISVEEARTLRNTNSKLWRKYVQEGKIDLSSLA